MISLGKGCSWTVHALEHELSAYYDITHGAGLAILTPSWMKKVLNEKTIDKFVEYGINVWNIDKNLSKMEIAIKSIETTKNFFVNRLKMPSTLLEIGIDSKYFETWADKLDGKFNNAYVTISHEDIIEIYKMSL